MNHDVSIIICTHNRKNLVVRAIDSALMQIDCNMEIIVVDDCSDDGTVEFLNGYLDDRIKLLSTEKNSGRAVASNLGFKHAIGNYIALLDDDDYWIDSSKLKKQTEVMQSNPSLGVLGTWWVEIKENSAEEKKPIPPRNRYHLIEKMLMGGGVVSGSSPLISREAWEKVGGMDVKQEKGIDSDLYRRIILSGYEVDVMKEVTTIADASHNRKRMTPVETREDYFRVVMNNCYIVRKHAWRFLFYPRAMFSRLKKIARSLAVGLITKSQL